MSSYFLAKNTLMNKCNGKYVCSLCGKEITSIVADEEGNIYCPICSEEKDIKIFLALDIGFFTFDLQTNSNPK